MYTRILPAIIANSQNELDSLLTRVRGKFEWVMLDFMDGIFVTSNSLMFEIQLLSGFKYEAHLMVKSPQELLPKLKGKVDSVIIHVESDGFDGAVKMARKLNYEVVAALNPRTTINEIERSIECLDRVLIMTVEPGRYGAPFIPSTLEKITKLRKAYPNTPIEVDGAMNPENVKSAKKAGANIFASGSYLMKSKDIKEAKRELENAIM